MPLSPIPVVAPNEPEKTDVPIKELVPIIREPEPVPIQPSTTVRKPEPEVQRQQPEVERKPEVQTPPPATVEAKKPDSEEKSSEWKKNPPNSEEKASESAKKRKVRYEGEGGRIHTEIQIDEILDFYLMTGELPVYVSDRQRYDYRHHERLPERKELLESRGVSIDSQLPSSTRRAKNVIPIKGASSKRKKRASGSV